MIRAAIVTAALLATTPVLAADLYIPVDEPMMSSASAYDWTGFYAGVHGGYGQGTVNRAVLPPNGPFTNSYGISGWLVGAHAGYNHQMDSFVLGIEGDINWTNISGNDAGVGGSTDTATINALGSLRARAGVTVDQLLLYVTAGVAAGSVTSTNNFGGPVETISALHYGWTAGAGIEYAVTEDVRVRGEYRYYDLGTQTYAWTGAFPASNNVTAHTGTLGISFAF